MMGDVPARLAGMSCIHDITVVAILHNGLAVVLACHAEGDAGAPAARL